MGHKGVSKRKPKKSKSGSKESLCRIYLLLFQSHPANDRWEIMNMRKKGIYAYSND
jgi:hypothetical protein